MAGELNATTRAVLKLQLGDEGGTRRINFSRLWDGRKSSVSFKKLFRLAVEYRFPDDAPYILRNYDVVVTYEDEDGDTITVSSDDELSEAFLQFVGRTPPVLRARATVKKQEGAAAAAAPSEAEEVEESEAEDASEPPAAPSPRGSASPSRQASAASSEENQNQQPPPMPPAKQLQTILESFVSVMASAVLVVQNHLAEANANANASQATQSQPQEPAPVSPVVLEGVEARATPEAAAEAHSASASEETEEAAKEDKKENKEEEVAKETKEEEDEKKEEAAAPAPVRIRVKKKEPEEEEEEEGAVPRSLPPVPADFDPDFIHGRHTCDACLQTPIVGVRYHAVNLPDYDLCRKCVGNYKGNDIEFEPVELARDRPLQLRWRRRQARRLRQARFHAHAAGYPGNRGRRPSHASSSSSSRRDRGTEEMDEALKEAIRRSLQDANSARVAPKNDVVEEEGDEKKKKEEEAKKEEQPKAEEEKVHDAAAKADAKVSDDGIRVYAEEDAKVPVEDDAGIRVYAESEAEKDAKADVEEEDIETGKVFYFEPKEEAVEEEDIETGKATAEEAEEAAEEEDVETGKVEGVAADAEASKAPDDASEFADAHATAPDLEKDGAKDEEDSVESTNYEDLVVLEADADADASVKTTSDPDSSVKTPGSPDSKSTYAEEAVGSGEIAEAIGATLDTCAEAIDAIVSEFDKEDFVRASEEEEEEAGEDDESEGEEAVPTEKICPGAVDQDSVSAMTSSFPSIGVIPGTMKGDVVVGMASAESEPELVDAPAAVAEEAEVASTEGGQTILGSVEPEPLPPPVAVAEERTVDDEAEAATAAEGQTILHSVGTELQDEDAKVSMAEKEEESEDDWSVVDEAAQKDAQVANDAALARAAELIGSALFQSDMTASSSAVAPSAPAAEDVKSVSTSSSGGGSSSSGSSSSSSSSSSSGFSSAVTSVGSVPTSVPTVSSDSNAAASGAVPSVLLARWETELGQLRMMGFDDHRAVDALEHLEAGNIGAGETGRVTVGDAVNYLLSQPR